MSDLTDNIRIWLCIRLNNAGKWACDRFTEDVDFGKKKIIFSDETHFDLAKYVNKQNCRNCEKPMHPKRVTVWCGFWSRGIIRPFFFENGQGKGRYSLWRSLSNHVERIFVHKNWRGRYWQHLVSIERRNMPHSRSYTRRFAPCFWRFHYQPQSWCRLATPELGFDTVGLLFVGCHQVLRRQARDNWCFKRQYSWSHWWNTAAHTLIMCLKIWPIVHATAWPAEAAI